MDYIVEYDVTTKMKLKITADSPEDAINKIPSTVDSINAKNAHLAHMGWGGEYTNPKQRESYMVTSVTDEQGEQWPFEQKEMLTMTRSKEEAEEYKKLNQVPA